MGDTLHKLREAAKERRLQRHAPCPIRRALMTAFIGALAAVEETFGDLWGHNKLPSERSEEERWWFSLYLEARKKILDNGYAQIESLFQEREDEKNI